MVSVIIPTYNGAHKLSGILNALKEQSFREFELIVVIDGSTDNTLEVLEKHKTDFSNFKIVYQENRGRAVVRNRGAKEASGKLLIFFDDDMLPVPDCIEEHIMHHETHPGSILTGAQIDRDGQSDIQHYKASLSLRWSKPLQNMQKNPLKKDGLFITAANFSNSKELFFKLGGFDERLTDAEDFDMAVRAFQQGIPLYYNHSSFAWHNDPVTGISSINRLRQYRKAHQQLAIINPGLYKDFPLHQPGLPKGWKKQVFLFFAKPYWIKWLDTNSGLKMMAPRFLRYKLYDWITTANGVYFPEKIEL